MTLFYEIKVCNLYLLKKLTILSKKVLFEPLVNISLEVHVIGSLGLYKNKSFPTTWSVSHTHTHKILFFKFFPSFQVLCWTSFWLIPKTIPKKYCISTQYTFIYALFILGVIFPCGLHINCWYQFGNIFFKSWEFMLYSFYLFLNCLNAFKVYVYILPVEHFWFGER